MIELEAPHKSLGLNDLQTGVRVNCFQHLQMIRKITYLLLIKSQVSLLLSGIVSTQGDYMVTTSCSEVLIGSYMGL